MPSFKGNAAVRRSRTPDSKTRASAAFIPGQARQIRVVNGRVEVEKVRKFPQRGGRVRWLAVRMQTPVGAKRL